MIGGRFLVLDCFLQNLVFELLFFIEFHIDF